MRSVSNQRDDPFNQNFRKFRSKTEWLGSVQNFRKSGSTFRSEPLFSVVTVRAKIDRSIWPFSTSTSLYGIFCVLPGGKHLSLQLLDCQQRIYRCYFNFSSMCSCNRSVSDSQANCNFWLFKSELFPERIWNVLFVSRKSCLNSYGKYLGMICSK